MATAGGPAIKVSVQTGGERAGGPALPVAVVTDGRAVQGGPAVAGYLVTSGPVQGGPAVPVVAAAAGAPVVGGPAIPLYVVSGVLGATAPVNTALPTISGTAASYQVLTATTGTWTNSPTSYGYQWKQNGAAIGGATSSSYTTVSADAGTTITVTVTATNAAGSASATSAGLVLSSLSNAIAYYQLESVAGVDATGRGNTLTPSVSNPTVVAGKVNNALSFATASSQLMSINDNTDLSTGDIDFTIACWVNLATNAGTTQGIVTKFENNTGNNEYMIAAFSSRFNFDVSSTGSNQTIQAANTLGNPSLNTWYFIVAWHDAVNDTINIQVNNGTVDSTAYSAGVKNGTTPFQIGSYGGTRYLNGIVDEVGFWKRVLTSGERTALYNGGNGTTWPFTGL